MPVAHISPSLLAADFGNLTNDCKSIKSVSDSFHFDVMDGYLAFVSHVSIASHFVPNISMGPAILATLNAQVPFYYGKLN